MKKSHIVSFLTGCVVLALTAVASAVPFNGGVVYDGILPVHDVPSDSVSAWLTTGNLMDGMEVTVTYATGASSIAFWADDAGASGTDWSLALSTYNTNTFSTMWTFAASSAVSRFTINAIPGNAVFDVIDGPERSPGSEIGFETFQSTTTFGGIIAATYSGEVHLNGTWHDDLYQTLTFDFSGSSFGSNGSDLLVFYADTDNIINPVPEPGTMVLLGTGLAILAGRRMRRKK